jgi:flagellar basal body rod protein FlgG
MKSLQIAATGMYAQQVRVEVISNNLANMSTTGYNARRADFADLHYQQIARAGTSTRPRPARSCPRASRSASACARPPSA